MYLILRLLLLNPFLAQVIIILFVCILVIISSWLSMSFLVVFREKMVGRYEAVEFFYTEAICGGF